MANPNKVQQRRRQVRRLAVWAGALLFLVLLGILLLRPATGYALREMYPRTYREYVERYSREYGVDKNLVYAVAKIESNFQPDAHSHADARGVMQMTKDAFEWVQYRMGDESDATYQEIFDPEVAIKYGTYMLKLLQEEMGSDTLTLCAYHAGMSNVRAWLENEAYSSDGETLDVIPYSDTNWYVEKVLEAKSIYQRIY